MIGKNVFIKSSVVDNYQKDVRLDLQETGGKVVGFTGENSYVVEFIDVDNKLSIWLNIKKEDLLVEAEKIDLLDDDDKIEIKDLEPLNETQLKIKELFKNFSEFLIEKNRRYGNSALAPIKIFSKIETDNQLCNRLDDKLNRIKNSTELRKNDLSDVLGYCSLLLIQKGWTDFKDLLD